MAALIANYPPVTCPAGATLTRSTGDTATIVGKDQTNYYISNCLIEMWVCRNGGAAKQELIRENSRIGQKTGGTGGCKR